MTTDSLRFKEIEHKFLVGDDFDLEPFRVVLDGLGPTRTTAVRVQDRYFLTDSGVARRFVVRHRYDDELHHLTVKTLDPVPTSDAEVRGEVNLDLGHHAGDQRAAVDAFVQQFGVRWTATITKDVRVWIFPDAEVVYYEASSGARSATCVEFEATQKRSLDEALAIVAAYERATGFDTRHRSPLSLLQILCPEIAGEMGLA